MKLFSTPPVLSGKKNKKRKKLFSTTIGVIQNYSRFF